MTFFIGNPENNSSLISPINQALAGRFQVESTIDFDDRLALAKAHPDTWFVEKTSISHDTESESWLEISCTLFRVEEGSEQRFVQTTFEVSELAKGVKEFIDILVKNVSSVSLDT